MKFRKKVSILLLFFASSFNLLSKESYKSTDTTNENDSKYKVEAVKKEKSPTIAIFSSLLLPGLGQVYVQQYWKAPIFFTGAAVLYYYTFKHHNDFLNFSKEYNELEKTNPQDPKLYYLKVRRENSRDNRDLSIFFLATVYGLSMLDAYVDAHLFSFNVNENITLSFFPYSHCFKFSVSIFY